MPMDRLTGVVNDLVARMEEQGTAKGAEVVVREVIPAEDGHGPRFLLEGQGDKRFIRMNANSYLGLSLHPEVIEAEERISATGEVITPLDESRLRSELAQARAGGAGRGRMSSRCVCASMRAWRRRDFREVTGSCWSIRARRRLRRGRAGRGRAG